MSQTTTHAVELRELRIKEVWKDKQGNAVYAGDVVLHFMKQSSEPHPKPIVSFDFIYEFRGSSDAIKEIDNALMAFRGLAVEIGQVSLLPHKWPIRTSS